MQIYTDPHTKEHYSFDSQAYMRFLMAQGFTEPEIDDLTIRLERVSDEAPYRACQGYYRHATCTICVWSRKLQYPHSNRSQFNAHRRERCSIPNRINPTATCQPALS